MVKVSGELIWYPEASRRLIEKLVELSKGLQVAVVPGGSVFADLVRGLQVELGFSDRVAHWMAIKSMEVYGVYLSSLHTALTTTTTLGGVTEAWRTGRVPVILPFEVLKESPVLPESWEVTSDAITVYLGRLLEADLALLGKVVDGVLGGDGRLLPVVRVGELERRLGVVDEHTPKLVRELGMPAAIFNVLKPWVLDDVATGKKGTYTLLLP